MSSIFGSSGGGSLPSIDLTVLGDYYRAQAQLRATPAASGGLSQRAQQIAASKSPVPWVSARADTTNVAKLRDALTTSSFVNVNDAAFSSADVSADQKKLFALYKGLSRLQALAAHAADNDTAVAELSGLDRRFSAGLSEIKSYLGTKSFDDMTLLFGERVSKAESAFKVVRPPTAYSGPAVVSGASSNVVPGLKATDVFTLSAVKGGATIDVTMDMSQISGDLSLEHVVTYMNQQLQAAGLSTRFTQNIFDGKTSTDPKRYGIGIQTTVTERLSFTAATTSPAIYVAGVSGIGTAQSGQLIKLADTGTDAATTFNQKVQGKTGVTDVKATTTDVNGNVYVVGTVTGDLGEAIVQGKQDAYLRKYDAAGQLVWSRLLGSSDRATGLALATDANGNVAIAGKVTDRLSSSAIGGGDDTFVTKYDSTGREVFTRQVAPILDDQANALTFGADGSLYVAGQTNSAMASGITHGGGTDAYLMKLSTTGSLDYVRQFGGSGSDRATSVAVDGDGNVILGSMENGQGMVRKLLPGDGTSAPVWEMNLGALGEGTLASVAVESGAVYVAGTTDNAALTAGGQASVVGAHSGGSDAYVMKIVDSGSTAAASFVSYLGTANTDSGTGAAVNNGEIYLSGTTNGSLTGGATPAASNGYVAKLDATGAKVWTHQYESLSGGASARAVTVDPKGYSVLDELGLPRGSVSFDETRLIATASSVRAGDYFFVKVNGGESRKITVAKDDTMRSLVTRVNAALTLKGEAVLTRGGGDGIRVTAGDGNVIELIRGNAGFDALAGLGLQPGKLDNTKTTKPVDAKLKDINVFALGLAADGSLASKIRAKTMELQMTSAMDAIKSAYAALTAPAKKTSSSSGNSQQSLSAYQNALAILG